jgi:hypothetical protein
MKKYFVILSAAVMMFSAAATSCKKKKGDDDKPKTVQVGAQTGSMTSGTAGTAAFPVTTANIANGEYAASVANFPARVSVQGNVTISTGSGTLTLAGSASTTAGETSTLRLTIDGTQSAAFALTIGAAVTPPEVVPNSALPDDYGAGEL